MWGLTAEGLKQSFGCLSSTCSTEQLDFLRKKTSMNVDSLINNPPLRKPPIRIPVPPFFESFNPLSKDLGLLFRTLNPKPDPYRCTAESAAAALQPRDKHIQDLCIPVLMLYWALNQHGSIIAETSPPMQYSGTSSIFISGFNIIRLCESCASSSETPPTKNNRALSREWRN